LRAAPGTAVLAGGRAECGVGGAHASRLECSAVLVCARAPSLISVRGPGWLRVLATDRYIANGTPFVVLLAAVGLNC
jgi:hypothetical protein